VLQIQVWSPTDELAIEVLLGFKDVASNPGGRRVSASFTYLTTGSRDFVTPQDRARLGTSSRTFIHDIETYRPGQAPATMFTRHDEPNLPTPIHPEPPVFNIGSHLVQRLLNQIFRPAPAKVFPPPKWLKP